MQAFLPGFFDDQLAQLAVMSDQVGYTDCLRSFPLHFTCSSPFDTQAIVNPVRDWHMPGLRCLG